MIYVTGDTHGDCRRLGQERLWRDAPKEKGDIVIICGDFGGIWYGNSLEEQKLNALAALPFTILFADGNHENFRLLNAHPISRWHGGNVHRIRENVIHLMRGQVYELEGKTFFVMGGAACHDIPDGVLDPAAPDFEQQYLEFAAEGKRFRVKGRGWWEQELPSPQELEDGRRNLHRYHNRVDFVISHCAPTLLQRDICCRLCNFSYPENVLTDYLQTIYEQCDFDAWLCGHYHREMAVEKLRVLYRSVIPLHGLLQDKVSK